MAEMYSTKESNPTSDPLAVKILKRSGDAGENTSQQSKKMKYDDGSIHAISQEDLTNVGLLGKISSRLNLQTNCLDLKSLNEGNSSADQTIDDDEDNLLNNVEVKSQPPSPRMSQFMKCEEFPCDHKANTTENKSTRVQDYREKICFKIIPKSEKCGKTDVSDKVIATPTDIRQEICRKIMTLRKQKEKAAKIARNISRSMETIGKTSPTSAIQKSLKFRGNQSFTGNINRGTPKVVSKIGNSRWIGQVSNWTNDSTNAIPLTYQNKNHLFFNKSPLDDSKGLSQSCPNLALINNQDWDLYKSKKLIFSNNWISSLPKYDLDELLKSIDNDIKFIDTHCHLDFLFKRLEFKGSYASFRKLNESSFPSCYEGCIAIFCDPSTFENNIKCRRWWQFVDEENVWVAFGCHPHYANKYTDEVESQINTVIVDEKVVALGEIGLDYSNRNATDRTMQQYVFRRQINLALTHKKPLIIHSRDAAEDTLEILKELVPGDYKIHRHCFTGDWNEAEMWLNTFPNLYLGFTPVVTYPTATGLHEVVKKISMQRLLLETDAPYFVPRTEDKNRKWSHPGMAIHVAAQIAALRVDVTLEDVLKNARENTRKMYGI